MMSHTAIFPTCASTCAGSTVCFVTNLGEEKPKHEPLIRVTQRFMRDGEPLGNQVTDDMFEAVRDESINHDDMDYWFTEKPGDIEEERFLKPLEEIPNTDFTVRNEDWDSVCLLPAFLHNGCFLLCRSRRKPGTVLNHRCRARDYNALIICLCSGMGILLSPCGGLIPF
jgi:hypothetical protein